MKDITYFSPIVTIYSETIQREGAFIINEVIALANTKRDRVPAWLSGIYVHVAGYEGDPDSGIDPTHEIIKKFTLYGKSDAIRYAIEAADLFLMQLEGTNE